MKETVGEKGHKEDETGHGTAVAGVAISDTFGVAKQANAIAVRVLNENNQADTK